MSNVMLNTSGELVQDRPGTRYLRVGKRLLDLTVAVSGLAITAPVFVFCAIAIPLSNRGPVFFRQVRVGQFGRTFKIFKFRSMVCDHAGPRITAAGDPRITGFGKLLRKTKIDEIPQLVNVLRGEMSIVGPRPEVPEYVAAYDARQRRVLQVKPGITGPAALRFVDEESLLAQASEQDNFYVSRLLPYKLEMELAYCEEMNLWQDVRLIAQTVMRIFFRQPEMGFGGTAS
jgi:lipopolysaccharide/colanic/teichoic acid biosynthesis glycosyltransferase